MLDKHMMRSGHVHEWKYCVSNFNYFDSYSMGLYVQQYQSQHNMLLQFTLSVYSLNRTHFILCLKDACHTMYSIKWNMHTVRVVNKLRLCSRYIKWVCLLAIDIIWNIFENGIVYFTKKSYMNNNTPCLYWSDIFKSLHCLSNGPVWLL